MSHVDLDLCGLRRDTRGVEAFAAEQLAVRLMAMHGLTERGWSFAFNRRKRSLGLCNYAEKRVELSSYFVAMNEAPEVRDTILHEIAHALVGHRAGHGLSWAKECRRLGAKPRRTCRTAKMPSGAFHARCGGCGRDHDRHRRPISGRTYYCRACGSRRGRLRFAHRGRPAVGQA